MTEIKEDTIQKRWINTDGHSASRAGDTFPALFPSQLHSRLKKQDCRKPRAMTEGEIIRAVVMCRLSSG